ncbi:MAG TPA: glycosyltransferase family 4 protein [Terriglobales bacterium]|nr:glycosyltransferase family 4 protein [Terriglobales bacterium]
MKPIRVVFNESMQKVTNPYTRLLSAGLAKVGVEVTDIPPTSFFLPKLLRQGLPDIFHIQLLDPCIVRRGSIVKTLVKTNSFLFQLLLLRLAGTKIVWTAHDLKNHENTFLKIDRWATRQLTRLASAVITHCNFARRAVIEAMNIQRPEKVVVTMHPSYVGHYPNTVTSQAARATLGIPENKLVFVFFGNIRPYKGVLNLIKVFKELDVADAQLVIAGPPLNEQASADVQRAIDQDSRVLFRPGYVDEKDVQIYLNAGDVIVFPYRDILTSGAVLLAASFGKACVAVRRACIAEVLDDEGTCFYDFEDDNGLEHAMQSSVTRRGGLAEMGRHNFNKVVSLTWDKMAAETRSLYDHILSK